jgi:SET domain
MTHFPGETCLTLVLSKKCFFSSVDKLYMDKSTVPEAGRGAFARRAIKSGEIISPIPTVLIGQRDLLEMFEIEMTDPNPGSGGPANKRKPIQVFNRERPLGKQLVTNYCYGHPESSLFLLPQAPMVNYVNHAPTAGQVNAHLQWSTHGFVSNDHATHDHTVEEVMNFRSNMVVLELVADKDIAAGEEVFINYGPEWVAAWEEYKTAWEQKHKNDKSWPLKAEDIKATFKDRPYPVMGTTKGAQLPDGTATVCFLKTDEADDGTPNVNDQDQDIRKWVGPVSFEHYVGADATFCDLIAVEEDGNGSWVYRAKARPPGAKEDVLVEVYGIPHVAITVVDQPYRSDVLNPSAFRHYIAVPDQQWPQLWRDLRD